VFEPNDDKRKWAHSQMEEAKVAQPIETAVLRLLEVWWTQNHTNESRTLTLDTFNRLARGWTLVLADPVEERWVQAKPGMIVRSNIVRVKSDAYQGDAGEVHNGRRGRVVAIRYGDIIVKYEDGKHPAFEGVHHSPHVLEKLI